MRLSLIFGCACSKEMPPRRILQHFLNQRFATQQSVAHFIVMLSHIIIVWFYPGMICAAIFKTDRVWSQYSNAFSRQRGAKGLPGIAHQAANFAFAKMSLSVMLMVNKYPRKRAITVRQ